MPTLKRARPDEDFEEVSPSKRHRPNSDDEIEVSGGEEERRNLDTMDVVNDGNMHRSDEMIEEEDEEEDEEEMEQEVRNIDLVAGVIKKVRLINFLNHRHFEVDLIKNINFFTGRNGSGKSAILSGIAIGLAASTKFTNRGKVLADFVNRAEDVTHAKVMLWLSNNGPDAYRPDEFGDSILVERTIPKFVADAPAERIVSNKKSDVVQMTECFCWRINNPCTILMQDTAKEFLQNSTPQSKYQFFLTGTSLIELKNRLHEVEALIEELENVTEAKAEAIPALEMRRRALKKECKEIKELETMDTRIESMRVDLCWQLVHEQREKVETLLQAIDDMQKRRTAFIQKIDKRDKRREEVQQRLALMEADITKASEENDRLSAEKRETATKLHGIQRVTAQITGKIKTATAGKRQKQKLHDLICRDLQTAKEQAENDSSSEIRRLEMEQAQLEQEREQIVGESEEAEAQIRQLHMELAQIDEQVRDVVDHEKKLNYDRNKLQQELRALDRKNQDRYQRFGSQYSQLVQKIQQERRQFSSSLPYGPIGAHLSVKDDRWSNAVEACCKSALEIILTPNPRDAELVQQIANRLRMRVTVLTSDVDTSLYRIPPNATPDQRRFLPMLSVLEADDARVLNVLIDQCQVEQMVLVEDDNTGQRAVHEDKRIKRAYEPNGAFHFKRGSTVSRFKPERTRGVLTADVEGRKRIIQDQIARLEANIQETRRQIDAGRTDKPMKMKQKSDLEKRLRANNSRRSRLERQIQNNVDAIAQYQPPDIAELVENEQQARMEVEQADEEIRRYEEDLEGQQMKEDELRERLEEATRKMDESTKRARAITRDADALEVEQAKLERIIAQYQAESEKLLAQVQDLEERSKAEERELQELTERARELDPEERHPDKSSKTIKTLIEAFQKQLAEQRQGFEEALAEFNQVNKHCKHCTQQLGFLGEIKESSEYMLEKRRILWGKLLNSNIKQIKQVFALGMMRRGHSGQLKFDTKKETLHIEVSLQSGMAGETTRKTSNTKTLSGGERSYTTVSLLVAMWAVMSCPVVAVDEFDVFMDQVNRMKSMELLMDYARSEAVRQYIFITPQPLDSVQDDVEDVKITRLRTPTREG